VIVLALCLGLGLVAVAVANSWPQRRRDRAAPHTQAADRAWSECRLEEAAGELARARQRGEPAAQIDRLWGLVYAQAGRPDEALPLLRRAWDQPDEPAKHSDPQVAEALARIYMERFELAEAAIVVDRWARDVPIDPKPLIWRANIDRRIGPGSQVVIPHYEEALRRDPACDEARLGLAEMLYAQGRFAGSAVHYAAYVARQPDDPAGHFGVALCARADGDMSTAIAALDKTLALDPNHAQALKERAAIDVLEGHGALGLRRLDRAIAADPFDPELPYQRSRILTALGRPQEAAADLRRSEQLRREHSEMERLTDQLVDHPTDNSLRWRAARWMIDHGRTEEGLQWARIVLRDQPAHPEANRLLADHHRQRGELGLAHFYELSAAPSPAGAAGPP
jgi:tetratricopeptide (TPR) repeat protein